MSQYTRPTRCDECRTRLYYYNEEDGFEYCKNGHKTTAALAHGEEYMGQTSRKTSKKREKKEKVSRFLKGQEATVLYIQCYQLLLWKQATWLIRIQGYQQELEVILKDLWALRLQMLGEILEDQDHSQFREDRVFLSSQQSGGEETDTNDTRRAKLSIRSRPPRLLESAVLCYFSMLLLRLPVLSSDLRSWIISDNFPYMHATKYLPLEMKQRLPDRLRYSLEPPADPHKLEHLHTTAMALAASYQTSFGMIIPGLNTPLILHKMIKTLCLPLCIYTGTERLAALLNLKFDFSRAMAKKIYISQHPEIALICAVIITTKLFFPMDEHRRYSTSTSEPAGLSINWPHWFQQFSASQKSSEPRSAEQQNASNAAHLATTEHDVFNMSTKQMDDYLDWFARTGWLDEEDAEVGKEKDYRHALYKMFPLDIPEQEESSSNTRERANLESIRAVHGTLRPNLVVEADEDEKVTGKSKVLRPGSKYRRYRSKEEMPETARIFYKAAGELVNLELDDIVLAVLQLEFRLGEWVDKKGKEAKQKARAEEAA